MNTLARCLYFFSGAARLMVLLAALVCSLVAAQEQPQPAPPAGTATPATVVDRWFTSTSSGFRIRVPRGWFFGPGPSPSDCTIWAPTDIYQSTPFTQLSIVSMARTPASDPTAKEAADMLQLTRDALKSRLANFQFIEEGALKEGQGLPVTTAGAAAPPATTPKLPRLGKYLVYSFKENQQELAGVVFFLAEPSRQFVCHGRCRVLRREDAQANFTQMLQTLEITGPPVSPWEAKEGRQVNPELNCSLTLPAGYAPESVGGLTLFRRPREDAAKPLPAQLSLSTDPLPETLQWVVYLERAKRSLRERLVGFKSIGDTVFTPDQAMPGVEVHLFEYSQQIGTDTVRVFGLYCLSEHAVLVLTGSAPENEYAAARDAIFLPAARSLQWTPARP